MSLSNYRWQHCCHVLQLIIQLKCVPLEYSFRTKPGAKSKPDITDLYKSTIHSSSYDVIYNMIKTSDDNTPHVIP